MDTNTASLIATLSVPLIGGVFSILGIVITSEITSHLKDKQAAAVLAMAVHNALGAMEQATIDALNSPAPHVLPNRMAVGVGYVFEHAGKEAERLGVGTMAVSEKINAQLGLRALAVVEAGKVAHAAALSQYPAAAGLLPASVVS
jgi:hypothetical protein